MGSCLQRADTVSQSVRDSQHHEVAIQRGTSIREEEGRGGEDPQEIPRSCPRHCREITQSSYWRFGQKSTWSPPISLLVSSTSSSGRGSVSDQRTPCSSLSTT